MQKLTAADPESKSLSIQAENLAALRALFPELATEGSEGLSVDLDVLKQLVGDTSVTEAEEKYGLNWHGKRSARQLALTPSTGTLRPCPEDSVDWDNTQNLMIEGDNLEVLKLLQKSYAGKVKLVYIDPPYNTGKDFVYLDNFQDSIRNYLTITGQSGEGGKQLSANTESSGRFHTEWLNMMYPRLKLARSLLCQDGVIMISIDDNENPRLRQLCDEIFGEENFVAQLVWTQGRKSMAAQVAINHEYCVVYCRDRAHSLALAQDSDRNDWAVRKEGLEPIYRAFDTARQEEGDDLAAIQRRMTSFYRSLEDDHPSKSHSHYNKVDARGLYFAGDISQGTGNGGRFDILHPVTGKPCKVPTGGWRIGQEKLPALLAEDRIHFGADHTTVPCLKRYLSETESEVAPSVFYRDGRGASKRLSQLMGASVFTYPKDEEILMQFIAFVTSATDERPIVMDFFAGSATTGHAVMAQNALDGGNRRYILVQLPEPVDGDNKDQQAAAELCDSLGKPRNIAELAKERLRRAGMKIQGENPLFAGDSGFRVFKLASSNIQAWEPDRDNLAQTLQASVEHLRSDRNEQDILCELLLKLGLDLCVPIEVNRIETGKRQHVLHSIGAGALIVCLSPSIPRDDVETLAQGLVAWYTQLNPAGESTVVFRDSAFVDDVAKTNLTAILQQHGLEAVRSL